MNLTLAIPVHDDLAGLRQVLAGVARIGGVERILILDDGSTEPVTLAAILPPTGLAEERVTLMRRDTAGGPGLGRNLLRDHVETSHVLFFDSDDLLTPEFPALLRDLAGQEFDFCLFKHADSRVAGWGGWGQMPLDEAHWRNAGVERALRVVLSPAQVAILSETANYPWNKIYRTDFLRANAIGCSEILVHEDVELHWQSFLSARRILSSSRIAARHFVASGRGRLTNRTGAERLALFGPLDPLAARVVATDGGRFAPPFFRFLNGLFDWIRAHLRREFHPALDAYIAAFYRARLAPELFERLARTDPALGLRLALQMERAAA